MTPEQKARQEIDAMLAAAGWVIQDRRRLNLHAAAGVALCETDVEGGFADYMLFVDAKAIGVLEAKAAGFSLVGVSDQSELYARAALSDFQRWADPLPFTFESNGEETRFRNMRDPRSRSRFVFGVHRPETLRSWVEEPQTFRDRLQRLPPLHTTGLRDCQVDAVNGLEKSFARNNPRALVQMATGSGKTWMAVAECYRLIKFGGAQRILFLVDRGNLGRQAKNEFDLWHSPYTQRRFTDEYIVQRLDGISLEPRAKVVISTIQRLYSALTGKPIDDEADERSTYEASGDTDEPRLVVYNPALPPETFDVIIIDECHRSIYNLWKGVLDYFDTFQVGLSSSIPYKSPPGIVDTHDAAAGDKLTAVPAVCSQAVKHAHKTHAIVFAVHEGTVKTGNIYINWNQSGGHEQSKSHLKRTATAMQSEEYAK